MLKVSAISFLGLLINSYQTLKVMRSRIAVVTREGAIYVMRCPRFFRTRP